MASSDNFAVGDRVFAKVRGWPYWPAKITSAISATHFNLGFYGSFKVGAVKSEDILPYTEQNLERFEGKSSRLDYKDGLFQIKNQPGILDNWTDNIESESVEQMETKQFDGNIDDDDDVGDDDDDDGDDSSENEDEEDPDKLIQITDVNEKCDLCHFPPDPNNMKVGPLNKFQDCQAHMNCLLFSSNMITMGTKEEGIKGFLLEDIKKEIKRGHRLKCKFCKNKTATIGCGVRQCKTSFHFPCGLENDVLYQPYQNGNFEAYCKDHWPVEDPANKKTKCPVCLDDVEEQASHQVLWMPWPCCEKWIHRDCIENMAEKAGFTHFSCPTCKNVNFRGENETIWDWITRSTKQL